MTSPDGARLRVDIRVAEPGQHRRELFRLTGLEVQEGQARRLLNDLRSFRAYLEQRDGRPVAETTAGHHWLNEVYRPVVDAIPPDPTGRRPPAEIFHEVLEHRWLESERAGRDIGTTAAVRSYLETVNADLDGADDLPHRGIGLPEEPDGGVDGEQPVEG